MIGFLDWLLGNPFDSRLGWLVAEGQNHFFMYPAPKKSGMRVVGEDAQPACGLVVPPGERPRSYSELPAGYDPVGSSQPNCAACSDYVYKAMWAWLR